MAGTTRIYFLLSLETEVQGQSVSNLVSSGTSLLGLQVTTFLVCPHWSLLFHAYPSVSLCVQFPLQSTLVKLDGLRFTLRALLELNDLFKVPMSKYSDFLR